MSDGILNVDYSELVENFQNFDGYRDELVKLEQKREENGLWDYALRENTIYTYNSYLSYYPNGKYTKEAKQNLNVLIQLEREEETKAWNKALNQNTKSSYEKYLMNYYNGLHNNEAKRKVDEFIRLEIAKKRIRLEKIEREEKLALDKEKEAWEKAKQINTKNRYNLYLKYHYNGLHSNEAKRKIDEFMQLEKKLEEQRLRDIKITEDRIRLEKIKQEKELTLDREKELIIERQLNDFIQWADIESISEEKIPRNIYKLKKLTYLDISNNHLTTLPESIGYLINLTHLDIYNNQLDILPESIGKLINLKELYLTGNNLRWLPNSFSNLINLKTLILSGGYAQLSAKNYIVGTNDFSVFPEPIRGMKNLEILSFSGTKITFISEWIKELKKLKTLFIGSHPKLNTLPEAIYKLDNLENLSISDNNLTALSTSIGNLKKLKHLDIKHNKISILPNSLSKLENLESITMQNNNIKKLPNDLDVYYIYAPQNNFSLFDIIKYKYKYGMTDFVI